MAPLKQLKIDWREIVLFKQINNTKQSGTLFICFIEFMIKTSALQADRFNKAIFGTNYFTRNDTLTE